MNPLARATLCSLLLSLPLAAQGFDVLVFSKTNVFRHDSIAAGITAIVELGLSHSFGVTATEDATQFNATNLALYDAVIFLNTTGNILNTDQETAFQAFIRNGGGFVGIHAAADTEYAWPWYGQLLGAHFASHPATQSGTLQVLDRAHPSTRDLPQKWTRTDEWYNFQASPRGNVHVLATLDETTYSGGTMGPDHPIAWCQEFEGGRSWYTALGHTTASYGEPLFRNHLLGGIRWAAGAVSGDAGATVNAKFEKLVLDNQVADPMALEVAPDGRVFFVERGGKVKIYSPLTQATTTAGTLEVFTGYEDGLLGLALDPNFATTGWIYIYYSPPAATPENVVARYTIANDTLVMNSRVQLLSVATQRAECCHSGGGMEFAANGELYLSIGDNSNPFSSSGYAPIDERPGRSAWDAQGSSGNANDLRGKILRIRPTAAGSYTIPAGNLFAPGTPQTRPEIYAMGCRNPFRIAVDPFTGHLYWGDVGPDANNDSATRGPQGFDEVNQARTSGNFGWPYFIANNRPYIDYNFATITSGAAFNPAAPLNQSPNNTGIQNLPPARSAFIWYPYGTATDFPAIRNGVGRTIIAGDIYQYDANSNSDVAFPEYFDRTLFIMEWSRNHLYEVKTDANADLLKITNFLPNLAVKRPMDCTFGPDGALYLLEWGSDFGGENPGAQISKIIYKSDNNSPIARAAASVTSGPLPLTVQFSSAGSSDPDPTDTLSFAWDFNLDGTIDSTAPNPSHTYTTAGIFTAQLRVTDQRGKTSSASLNITAGNTAPVVTFIWPPDGAFFDWGDDIAYEIRVDDAEDGSTTSGGILPSAVQLEVLLGHTSHAHGTSQTTGTRGSVIADNTHNFGEDLFFALDASYADRGAPGVGSAIGRRTLTLQPKCLQAEFSDATSGTDTAPTLDHATGNTDVSSADHGDWIALNPINLLGIQQIGFRYASAISGARIEVRADAADGPLLATVDLANTGLSPSSYRDAFSPITDPGGTRTLYFVFLRNPGDTDLCRLNWINFRGPGATKTAKPPRVLLASGAPGSSAITVDFDEIMDATSLANLAHYSIAGISVTAVTPAASQKSVILATSSTLAANQPYVLALTGLRDLAGDPIAPLTRIPFRILSHAIAINVGGSSYLASDGANYLADQFFSGGNTFTTASLISATLDDPLYQSERWGSYTYAIPLPNGTYSLTLKFAEIFFTQNGQRVFSVTAEGSPIITNLDLFAQVGINAAYDRTFPVTITDGTLNLGFSASVNNASLTAILIANSPQAFTDFPTWQAFYFSSANAPNAAPELDPDGDFTTNALEYALGGDPIHPQPSHLLAPQFSFSSDNPQKLSLRYRKAIPTLNYRLEWSNTLLPNDWTEAATATETYFSPTNLHQREITIDPSDPRKFIRLNIAP